MADLLDIFYSAGVLLSAPFWLMRGRSRRKVLAAFRERMGGGLQRREGDGPCVWIHAVSVGEINATPMLIRRLIERRPGLEIAVSVTTDTGFARAKALYGGAAPVRILRYPLDFSAAVGRALEAVRPTVVALMELEVWPNFIARCVRRGVPVALVNGRLSDSSFKAYSRARGVLAPMFRRLARVCAQDAENAARFAALGAVPGRVSVTGTMKFDTAQMEVDQGKAAALAESLGLAGARVWVCGSTGPGEEEIILDAHRRLVQVHPEVRLVIVPRHPERFDAVARLIEKQGPLIRRSAARAGCAEGLPGGGAGEGGGPAVVLGDTMGELRLFYALADVVFVGRTLVDLGAKQHGSDMIEPAALGKPVLVGPFTGNFADVMRRFRARDAIIELERPEQLFLNVEMLLREPGRAQALGALAREVVAAGRGATERHATAILECIAIVEGRRRKLGRSAGGGGGS